MYNRSKANSVNCVLISLFFWWILFAFHRKLSYSREFMMPAALGWIAALFRIKWFNKLLQRSQSAAILSAFCNQVIETNKWLFNMWNRQAFYCKVFELWQISIRLHPNESNFYSLNIVVRVFALVFNSFCFFALLFRCCAFICIAMIFLFWIGAFARRSRHNC